LCLGQDLCSFCWWLWFWVCLARETCTSDLFTSYPLSIRWLHLQQQILACNQMFSVSSSASHQEYLLYLGLPFTVSIVYMIWHQIFFVSSEINLIVCLVLSCCSLLFDLFESLLVAISSHIVCQLIFPGTAWQLEHLLVWFFDEAYFPSSWILKYAPNWIINQDNSMLGTMVT